MLDAIKGYVELATGLTEVTVKRAQEAAGALVQQGMALLNSDTVPDVPGKDQAVDAARTAASSVQELADDLLETSKQNRELLIGLIRTEVDRSAGRMGFVREEELAAVRRHIARLENQIADMRSGGSTPSAAPSHAAMAAEPVAAEPMDTSTSTADAPEEQLGEAAAQAKVEALVEFGTVDDSKVEDVIEAFVEIAEASAEPAPAVKRKIPYVKPGTENGGDAL
jgi:polyhydroxyalkanoate synthesis regulator phasin